MNTSNLIITDHARARFMERMDTAYPDGVRNPEMLFKKLLEKSIRDNRFGMAKISRLIKHANSGKDTSYYVTKCGWRFVVTDLEEGKRLLVTVERINPAQNK
jgi:hypothetical protein